MRGGIPTVEAMIFGVGIVAAVAAGTYGYRTVGLYGDGPFASGYHRETDPKTGESLLIHEVNTSKGRVRRVIDLQRRVREVGIDVDGDGVVESTTILDANNPAGPRTTRLELDQNKNGKVDTIGYLEGKRLLRAELDLDENGVVERWEYYNDAALIERTGSSSKADGVVDTWSYPDAGGFLAKEEFDDDRDGRVDRRTLYVAAAGSGRTISVVELNIDASGVPERRLHYRLDGSLDRIEVVR